MSGTLESTGLNKNGITSAPVRNLGFTSISHNATTNPPGSALGPGGISQSLTARGESLVNMINTSNDTTMADVPEGTIERMLE